MTEEKSNGTMDWAQVAGRMLKKDAAVCLSLAARGAGVASV